MTGEKKKLIVETYEEIQEIEIELWQTEEARKEAVSRANTAERKLRALQKALRDLYKE